MSQPVRPRPPRPEDYRPVERAPSRQIIPGNRLRPPTGNAAAAASGGVLTAAQRTYLLCVGVLLFLALLVLAIFSMGVASVLFFLLSLALIAGALVF